MFAVIKTGSKQYKVAVKDKIKVDKLDTSAEKDVTFSDVLLIAKDKEVIIGKPMISGAKVVAKVLQQGKGDKIIIYKYKSKKRYQKKMGFRSRWTQLEILKITS